MFKFKKHSMAGASIPNQTGFSLIELMVALVIGLIVSLAVYTVLTNNEGRKRTITSTNDIDQAGSYALYQLDKAMRSAGSGFMAGVNPNNKLSGQASLPNTPAANYTLGCLLKVAKGGVTLIPSATAYPEPFATVKSTLTAGIRVAPIIILDGLATRGDVLMVMAGSAGLSESINPLVSVPTANTMTFANSAGFRALDRILLTNAGGTSEPLAGANCIVEQVAPGYVSDKDKTIVELGNGTATQGDYYQAVISGTSLTSFSNTAVALNLGRQPTFSLFGVGANNTLFKYDLLRSTETTNADRNPMEYVDSVYQLEAVYGISPTKGALTWQQPTGDYAAATLLNGSAASNANLKNIKAVRIALVMRTSLLEKNNVSNNSLVLFENTDATNKITINTTGNEKFRFKVIESTIPIRNALAIARD